MHCYRTTKADEYIGKVLHLSGDQVANLRGMLDEAEEAKGGTKLFDLYNIDEDNPNSVSRQALVDIAAYRHQTLRERAKKMQSVANNTTESLKTLKSTFTAEERVRRTKLIATMFSATLDMLTKANPNVPRKALIQGFKSKGQKVAGQFAIFQHVYEQLEGLYYYYSRQAVEGTNMSKEEATELASKYKDILDNFGELCTFARLELRNTEGLKLGNKIEYVSEATLNNFSDNDLSVLWDASESTRESWQTQNGMESAFGSVGTRVRKLLSTIPSRHFKEDALAEGRIEIEEDKDDLGFPIYLDPVQAHQMVLEHIRGVKSESELMERLEHCPQTWAEPLRKALLADAQLRTAFINDMRRNFLIYRKILKDTKEKVGNVVTYLSKNLNLRKVSIFSKYIKDLLHSGGQEFMMPGTKGTPMRAFDANTTIVTGTEGLSGIINSIKETLYTEQELIDDKTPKTAGSAGILSHTKVYHRGKTRFNGLSQYAKSRFLMQTMRSLGYNMSADEAAFLLSDSKKLRKVINSLKDLVKYGFEGALTKSTLESLEKGEKVDISWQRLLKTEVGVKKERPVEEKLREILRQIESLSKARTESKVKTKDKKGNTITMYSDVNPSYLGDKLEAIQGFVKANDKAGLRKYLEETFLKSSFFYDKKEGKILNWWLRELVACCDDVDTPLEESFAAQFNYDRLLGSDEVPFEDFTSKQHAIEMLIDFNADKEISKGQRDTALYPVFILGDSGVCKHIRAKRYTEDEIIDGMYDVYLQEKQRQALVAATNEWLEKEYQRQNGVTTGSFSRVENYSDSAGKFTALPFLNESEYALSANPSEAEVKQVIKRYLDKAAKDFEKKLARSGVLETTTINKNGVPTQVFTQISQFSDVADISKNIRDFFYNTKFATIQQIQLMTIDPSYYFNTKDLQKRYKEIHAPGKLLSIEALWDGERVTDGWERCVYFDDITVNGEESDSAFMAAIANHKNMGAAYKKYLENTLTDGQGYRSLKSYRAVKIMAAEWSKEDESCYRAIRELQSKLKNPDLTEEQKLNLFEQIAAMAVTFMPIKPYMFTHERIAVGGNDVNLIPVQHKYAEVVLIPELLPEGSMLKDMAEYMEDPNNNIDLICSTKCVKVGAFGSAKISKNDLSSYDAQIRAARGDDSEITDKDRLRHALSLAYVHKLDYSDYRIQTNVPEHINSSQLFGTQIRKLIMSGIDFGVTGNDKYTHYVGDKLVNINGNMVKLSGRNLVSFYNSLIVANILDSFDIFEKELSTLDKVSAKLIQNTLSNNREAVENIIAYSVTGDNRFLIPLFEGGLEHDTMAFLLSLFRKMVNKQSIKGGSAVQASAMGLAGYEESGGLHYVACDEAGNEIRITGEETPEELAEKKRKITNIKYVECEMPWDLSYVDENGNEQQLNFSDWCNSDGTLKKTADGKSTLLEEKYPKILDMIAYRIPTERAYSMLNLKVVRFSQKVAGGTIKVPAQGTTIAGFDFDIDKLYFMRRSYDQNGLVEYHLDKTANENSKEARDNQLLDIMQARLEDPETFEARYTPGGFDNASRAARIQRELEFGDLSKVTDGSGKISLAMLEQRAADKKSDPEPNYDYSDPGTILYYNQQNQIAAKLIGIFANHNTNHAFTSLMEKFKLKQPIKFAGKSYDDLIHAPKGTDPDLTIAEFLAASVDAVKDPVLNYLNFNTVTANSAAFLARLGFSTTEIGMLLNQPVIKILCDKVFNEGYSLDVAIDSVYRDLVGKDAAAKTPLMDVVTADRYFTIDALLEGIVTNRKARDKSVKDGKEETLLQIVTSDAAARDQQVKVLKLFKTIGNAAEELSQFVQATKFTAANSVGSTAGAMYEQQLRVQNYITKLKSDVSLFDITVATIPGVGELKTPVNNGEAQLSMSTEEYMSFISQNPFAFEQAMFDMNRRCLKVLDKFYPYSRKIYRDAREIATSLTKSRSIKGTTIDSIHRDLMAYLLAREELSEFNGNNQIIYREHNATGHVDHITSIREYYTEKFPELLFDHLRKHPELQANYAVLRYLTPKQDKMYNIKGLSLEFGTDYTEYIRDEIMQSWAELAQDFPQIAKDLFLYNYYKLGFNYSPESFMNLAPVEVKELIKVPSPENPDRTYVDFLNEIMDDNFSILKGGYDFIKQYVLNHTENYEFVFEPKGTLKELLVGKKGTALGLALTTSGNYKRNFYIDLNKEDVVKSGANNWLIRSDEDSQSWEFRPFIKVNGKIYMAQGTQAQFNFSDDARMKYVLVGEQGTTNVSTSYYGELQVVDEGRITHVSTENPEILTDPFTITDISSESLSELAATDTPGRDALIRAIANELARGKHAGVFQPYAGQEMNLYNTIKAEAEADSNSLIELVDNLRRACRQDGVLMLDAQGNLQIGC